MLIAVVILYVLYFIPIAGIVYLYWKQFNFELSRKQLFEFCQTVQEDVVKIKRSMSRSQGEIYSNSACQECQALLPENTVRTHDGKLLCADCKQKHFAVKHG